MKAERDAWEARYRTGEYSHDGPPSGLLRRWLPRLPRGRALDVAAGLGRNALFLARAGYRVDAVDISPTGFREAARRARRARLRVHWVVADVDTYRFPKACYSVVVNTFFLKRRLLGALRAAVRPGGVIILETHLESSGDDGGPRKAAHRLRPGELKARFKDWEILDLQEGVFREGRRLWRLGRIVARRPPGRRTPATRAR